MTKEAVITLISWILTCILLIIFVPKNRTREALVIFFFKQLITWLLGLTIVELGLIKYPYRQFPHATLTSFTFEFFVYPAICVFFCLYYPKNSKPKIAFHYFIFCTVITTIEVILEVYTSLIVYIHWNWFYTWISLLITFFISRKFYVWFYRLNEQQ